MPIPLDPRDRRVMIVAGILLLLIIIAFTAVAEPSADSPFALPTTYSSGSAGARAAFLLLHDLGYSVSRWERPLNELPADPAGKLLILAEPIQFPASAERMALRRFVQGGGRVIATGSFAGMFLPEAAANLPTPPPIQSLEEEEAAKKKAEEKQKAASEQRKPPPRREVSPPPPDLIDRMMGWRTFRALTPGPITRNAPEILMLARIPWEPNNISQIPHYGRTGEIVVVSYRFGKGQVIWWAGATPLMNAGIREKNNLQFFLNCIGTHEQTTILWDEYYHGYGGSLFFYFRGTPVPWIAVQLALVFVAVLLTFSRRQVPPRAVVRESRLSPLEFVETLGDLYHRARASGPAVEIASNRFRFLLTRRLGMAANTSAEQLARSARERLGWTEPGLLDTLLQAQRAARSGDLSHPDALRLVQALHHYSELLRLRPRTFQEKP